VECFQQLVDPGAPIPEAASRVNGITDRMVRGSPPIEKVLPDFLAFLGRGTPVAHNALFDVGFLAADIHRTGRIPPAGPVLDTRGLARRAFPARSSYSLRSLARDLRMEPGTHRALADAHACRELFLLCRQTLGEAVSPSLLASASGPPLDFICHTPRQVGLAIQLAGAALSGAEVRIEYRSSRGEITVRDIRPLKLIVVGGSVAVRAHCRLRGEERTFLLGSLMRLELLEPVSAGPAPALCREGGSHDILSPNTHHGGSAMQGLTSAAVSKIDGILDCAARESRRSLFEHEVYGVLSALGLTVPRFLFVRELGEVSEQSLSGFGHSIIVKIVSPDIPHKQKLGGVKKVSAVDPLYVQFVLSRMREEVLSHFAADAAPRIAGFLVVEYIPHTQAIGYEVLIGFREDPAFGPVLTVSKGGDDAEFFAAHYDPANLFLPPMEYPQALAFTRSMHIRHKFEQIGHPEYLEHMAHAMAGFSGLALAYSPMAEQPRFAVTAFEINPFAISSDGRFVAIDGLAEYVSGNDLRGWSTRVDLSNLDAFFRPRGIAVVGVSSDVSKYNLARDVAELLHELRPGDLYLVNPRGGTVRFGTTDYPLYKDLRELPVAVELAVYAAPAQAAPEFLRSLAGGSVRAVVLIPGVPSSTPYQDYARSLLEALPPGIRIMGPNCMGVYQAATPDVPGLNTLFINEKRLEVRSSDRSNAVLLTQSGALAVTVIDKLRNCRPLRSIVSFGNKVDVRIGDLLSYFERDSSVDVMAVYLEGLDPGEGRAFFDRARESAKPIIAYKGGRTEAGARSAASHTASMSGDYSVFQAACLQAGVILAETIEAYYDLIKSFALLASRPPRGNKVAGVVNAGFESTVGADELRGLTQARLGPRTVERLGQINKHGLVDVSSPFLDITPMADDAMYAQFVEAVIEDQAVDCVFVAIVPHAVSLKTVPETCRDPDGLARRLVQIAARHEKPMVVSVNAGRYYGDFVAALEEGGLPVYSDIRSAITSLDTFVSYNLGRQGAR
jgi:3-hydroxypropionyl-CoA synthetase (ADP-forming)